ncbi:MAG TPA: UbiH/UbiF family hydroxylase [Burkholderiales bacterium]|nr:UbiH/UbiF family hydroxylase [Burkholderiales bacterium]
MASVVDSFDIAVVGGGVVGASFALALSGANVSVVLVEPQRPCAPPHDSSWDTRVYTISPGNAEWLRGLDVWDQLPRERLCGVESMLVYGDQNSSRLEFDAYDAGLRDLAQVVENRQLQHALWNALERSAHVSIKTGSRCADIRWERERAQLELEDGNRVSARLIVAADGADSWARSRVGIKQYVHDYAQLGVVANFATERSHNGTAFQWFLSDGVLAMLPLPDDRFSMVWSAPESYARDLVAAPAQRLCDEVGRASCGTLGRLELISAPVAFPLRLQRVERLVEPRAALVGDAAHNVHPLAGQGVNLGLRDARELARVIDRRGAQHDCGDYGLLRRYERARKEDIMALQLMTHGLEKLFSARPVSLSRLRNMGLALVDAQPLLKKALIQRAVL